MAQRGSTFKFNGDVIGKLSASFAKTVARVDTSTERRMAQATHLVWGIAHQRRPKIGLTKLNRGKYRVSDPNAEQGVPVKTGRLQGSITERVEKRPGYLSYQGIIETKGVPYAAYMEYGTSRIQARPFMRPAITATQDALKKLFGAKIESNL